MPDRIEDYLNNLVPKYPDTKFVFSFSIDNIEDKHNKIRKIDNLFNHAWNLIRLFKNTGINVYGNISITVSLENYHEIEQIYEKLINKYNVKALTAVIVRDEGIYKTPKEDKEKLLKSYKWLTEQIQTDEIKIFCKDTIEILTRKTAK